MRKLLAATALGGALFAGALAGIGPASATTNYYPSGSKGDQSVASYYSDLTAEGLGGSYAQASGLGATVCRQLGAGASETDLISTVMETPEVRPTIRQAKVVVWSAEWHFCPSYY